MNTRLRQLISTPRLSLLACYLLLIGLPLLVFWEALLPFGQPQRAFEPGDFHDQMYPNRVWAAAQWRAAQLPLWDDSIFGGWAALGDPQHAVFYPPTWLQAFWKPPMPIEALQLEALLHLSLTGCGMFAFLYRLTQRRAAALWGAVIWQCSGLLTAYPLLQTPIVETLAWLPWCLWAQTSVTGAVQANWRAGMRVGLLLGLSILAGHPQTAFFVGTLSTLYGLLGLRRNWRAAVGHGLLAVLVALGSSAAQWLPTAQATLTSARPAYTYSELAGGFTPAQLSNLIFANEPRWNALYLGLLPCLLALFGLLRRWRVGWLFGAVAIFALGLSLGGHGFVFPLIYRGLGKLVIFRQQERAVVLVIFCICTLAALGLASILALRPFNLATQRVQIGLLLAVTALSLPALYQARGRILADRPAAGFFAPPPVLLHLWALAPSGRVSGEGLLPGSGNAARIYQLRDVNGISPLLPSLQANLWGAWPENRLWQLLNVQFVLTRRQLNDPALLPVLSADGVQLYQYFGGQQPVWLATQVLVQPTAAAARQAAANPALNIWETVVLETDVPSATASRPAQITIQVSTATEQRYRVDSAAAGVLVSSEIAAPGWQVHVDGQPAPALRAYGTLRAVALPAGQHTVVWHYRPWWVYLAIWVSLLSSLGALWATTLFKRPAARSVK